MNSLEFLTIDDGGNIGGIKIYYPNLYKLEELELYYQQLYSYLLYKDRLYDQAVNNINISNLLSKYTCNKDRLFMKKVLETLIYLDIAHRDPHDYKSLYLDFYRYKLKKNIC
jgi:hypothetical protein